MSDPIEFLARGLTCPDLRRAMPDDAERLRYLRRTLRKFAAMNDPHARSLRVTRPVENGPDILEHLRAQGVRGLLPAGALVVEVGRSRSPVDWYALPEAAPTLTLPPGGPRSIEVERDGTISLRFRSDALALRNAEVLADGLTSDRTEFAPRVVLGHGGLDRDPRSLEPWRGPLLLGPERFDEWDMRPAPEEPGALTSVGLQLDTLRKAEDELRTAWGWFSVTEVDGAPVVDLQGDVIRTEDLVRRVHRFMRKRTAKVMHAGAPVGEVVESIVFTPELQEALGIDLGKVGWFGAMRFEDDAAWESIKAGRLRMFSIGGPPPVRREIP